MPPTITGPSLSRLPHSNLRPLPSEPAKRSSSSYPLSLTVTEFPFPLILPPLLPSPRLVSSRLVSSRLVSSRL
eukprot:462654-Hanusia_phi.AAC.1